MKLRYLVVLAAMGAILVFASSAMARRVFPTTIIHDGSAALTGGYSVESGHLSTPRSQCRLLRLVKLIGHYPSGSTKVLDLDLTSFRGAWAMKADLTGTDHLTARVTKYKFGRRGHRKVCQADSVGFSPPPPAP